MQSPFRDVLVTLSISVIVLIVLQFACLKTRLLPDISCSNADSFLGEFKMPYFRININTTAKYKR